MAYVCTWIVTIPLAFAWIDPHWHAVGSFGPTIAAIYVIKRFEAGSAMYLKNIFRLASWKALLFSVSPLLLGGITITFSGPVSIDNSDFLLITVSSLVYGIFEEIGWRGYAIPTLQQRFSPLLATGILTIVWAVWHAPMFWYRFQFNSSFMVVGFIVSLFFGAILLTSSLNINRGSIIAPIIFHITNNIVYLVKENSFVSTYSTLLIVYAILVLIITKGRLFYTGESKLI